MGESETWRSLATRSAQRGGPTKTGWHPGITTTSSDAGEKHQPASCLNALRHNGDMPLSMAFEVTKKPLQFCDPTTRQTSDEEWTDARDSWGRA